MILYKYVPFKAGQQIIETATIGFSRPEHFNDPFDTPVYPDESGSMALDRIPERIHVMGKQLLWGQRTGVLSLTRTPTNPLMWAHYAEQHRGLVIGIDVVAAGLTGEAHNLIPAQYGNVIYVSRRLNQPFIGKPTTGIEVGGTHHFPQDHYEELQRLFLHKPLCWSYEEEVRVVKCLQGVTPGESETPSGKFTVIDINGRPLYLVAVPREAIREIHFGFRSDDHPSDELYYRAKELMPHLLMLQCHLLPGSFSIGADEYTTIADAMAL
ncbi:DUF2971 domain-containing protein [Caulobacter sp. FWC26]|uniref:DUF2971 domain-containing protein n=1 Tax=Caulobacter sp. FWC26 TaxID=69665 RepID=UPI000C149CC4|nr:DUF2971 domain-containing protein [Caulobacter sp. FWC26]AZS22320.1 DUF2971 domain-containing protein [Caulobacter sp. FWC26]